MVRVSSFHCRLSSAESAMLIDDLSSFPFYMFHPSDELTGQKLISFEEKNRESLNIFSSSSVYAIESTLLFNGVMQ